MNMMSNRPEITEVYEKVKNEIPYGVGVSVPEKRNYRGDWYDLKSVKKATRKDRDRPVSEMLLMMFRSAARDSSMFEEVRP